MTRTYDDRMFIDTFEHQYTWLNGFMRNVRRYKNRLAIIDASTEQTWTYTELNVAANKLANALKNDGVDKNDVVMTTLINTPEFVFTYVGPRKIGAILNPCNFNLSGGELAALIDHNRPKVYIYSADIRDAAVNAIELCEYKPERVVMVKALREVELPQGHIAYDDYVADAADTDPVMDFEPHIYDEVLRLCTSGTTSLPKNVPVNDINEVLSAHDVIMHYPMNCNDVLMNMTPWFHRGGCHSGGPGPTLYAGACLVVCRTFVPRTSLQWTAKYKVTFLMGAPSTLDMLARMQTSHPVDLSSLKGLVTMGAPFEKSACMKYMEVLTPNIFNGYGTTETFWNSFLRPYDLPDGSGSVGGSCTDDEVRVVNVYDDRKAEPDDIIPTDNETVGEVIIWSPAKSTYSYYDNEDAQTEKFYKGWMYTGDLGYWDDDLYVTINGRKDDMIVCSAENIYPAQVEEVLNEFEKVEDSIVTAVPDKLRGQAVVAYIVAKDPELTAKELAAYCNASPMLSAYKCPRYYRFIDKIPLNATGKKLHRVVKEQAEKDLADGLLIKV